MFKIFRNIFLSGSLLMLLFTGCNRDKPHGVPSVTCGPPLTGMKFILDSLYKQQIFPQNFTRNDLAVKLCQQRLTLAERDSPAVFINQCRMELAYQLLFNNQIDTAISIFTNLLYNSDKSSTSKEEMSRRHLFTALAISYMRKGEVQNCLTNHNATSCIYPFDAAALHLDPSGSDSAMVYLLKALDENAESDSNVWLLNLLAMTVNKYPEAVPSKFRVDLEKYSRGNVFPRFRNIAAEKGVDYFGHFGGADVEDFNNDGLPDVFCTSSNLNEGVKLYIQTPDSGFIDFTQKAGLSGITGGVNTIHADFDNDGLNDIFIMRGGWQGLGGVQPASLLKNLGNGKFEDVTIKAGLLSFKPSHTACWGDFNNDGLLDLFVGHENNDNEFSGPFPGRSCELYLNNGNGTFSEVSDKCGLKIDNFVKGSVWFDYNNDGKLDLYISNFGGKNLLYRNEGPDINGTWHFTEVAGIAGVQEPQFSFPVAAFDINQDGWDDLYVGGFDIDKVKLASEYQGKVEPVSPPKIFINQKNGTFKEMSAAYGIHRSIYAMALNYGDLDLDGYPDLYLATGFGDYSALFPNILLRNVEGRQFADVTSASGTGHLQKGHGIAICDIDHDGDNDIFARFGGFLSGDGYWSALFENPGNSNKWISLKLEGTKANRSAIGSRIKVTVKTAAGKHDIYTKIGTGGSYGASSLQQLIGLGKAESIESLEIIWPGTTTAQIFHSLSLNKAYWIKENSVSPQELPYAPIRGKAPSKKKMRDSHVM
ncbi:MAG: repeat protein [Bacteroidota bacterium]|nr:repeat protein [Bacteroidota bacterium]